MPRDFDPCDRAAPVASKTGRHTGLIWIINRIPYPLQFTPPPPPCAPLYYEPQYKQYESEYNASCDRFYTLGAQVCNSYYGPYYETPNMEEEYGFRTFISRSHELRTAIQAIQERIQNVLCIDGTLLVHRFVIRITVRIITVTVSAERRRRDPLQRGADFL